MSYKKKAFTLVEIVIAFTIFAMVAVMSVQVMSNILRSTKKIRAQVFLYTESQALMDIITRDVQRNAIDYEGYYARNVQGELGWDTPDYGLYGQAFVSPGDALGPNPGGPYPGVDGYGTYCSDGVSTYPEDCPGTTPIADSLDYDTGANPFTDIDNFDPTYSDNPDFMNAFCASKTGSCEAFEYYKANELLLINSRGDQRLVIRPEAFSASDNYMSKAVLLGTDTNNDGIEDSWVCDADFTCTDPSGGPSPSDLTDYESPQDNFLPISPSALSVSGFYVIVSPIEDPYRAFAEGSNATQVQPQVTVVLTTTLSSDFSQGILGEVPSLTIQRTISTGVYDEVTSY